ncbi:hypothetical protein FPANT_8174 [Fusarium pseudoanthophilum]|uniref:2EXR domain-containing protein n=1 Tax=Fusarium pseudoanthophilum TaxID=48495 RepID=A0A8H5KZ94_9HYPO|nr:hypothetical protein FPANT_8174 [Fusarium pseudoanthophilum]
MSNFQSLPLEIRQEIYLLATPARVVHLKAKVSGCTESYGRLLLWNFNWLQGPCPPKQYFYSNAPVPALLHTCSEARDFLRRKGYQLTFKSKTQGPRTWFNYDRDVLLEDLVSCNSIHLDTDEAARVRRLAVDCITDCLYDSIGYDVLPPLHSCEDEYTCLYPLIEDFPALEEVFVVDWKPHTLPRELTRNPSYPVEPPSMRHCYETENLWKCVKVEDSSLFRTMQHHDIRPYSGPKIVKPPGYGPAPRIADWGTFGHRSAYLLLELAICRQSQILSGQKPSVGDWRAPKTITPVHLINKRQQEILQQKQKAAVDELRQLREHWAPVLEERKQRIDAGGGVPSERELHYLEVNRWEMACWIEKDIFSSLESED